MKKCKKCKEYKNITKFGKHRLMTDGLNNWCKCCCKKERSKESYKNSQKAYEDANREKRNKKNTEYNERNKEKIKAHRQSESYKKLKREHVLKHEKKYPNAHKCRSFYHRNKSKIKILNNCEICDFNKSISAHHNDYNKPLDVMFLCSNCHSKWHQKNTALNRVSGIFTSRQGE
jgi:hypothetical protein